MKTPSLLIAGFLIVPAALLLRAGTVEAPLLAQGRPAGLETEHHGDDCGGEPCDAVARGFRAFFDRKPDGLGGNGRACADCHMATDNFQLSPADVEARFQLLQCGAAAIPMPTIRCSGRSTPTTSGPTARTPATSAICARTVSSGSPSRCRRTSGSIDPATNAPSARNVRGRVAERADASTTWRSPGRTTRIRGRAVRTRPADISWTRASRRCRNRRSARSQSRADPAAPRNGCSTTCRRFSACCSRNHRVRALADAVSDGRDAAAGSGSAAQRARAAGQGRVRARVRAVPRRSGTVDAAGAGDSIPRHCDPVSAARRHGDAGPLRVRAVPAATRPQRADLRDHAWPNGAQDPPHELRSRPRAADRVRRRPRAARTTGTSSTCPGFAASARPRRTSTTTARPRWKRSSTTTSSSSSACRSTRRPASRPADRDDRRRAFRSRAAAGGARGAARLPAEALGSLFSEWDHRCSPADPLTVAFRLTGRAITKWRGAWSATGLGQSTSRSLAQRRSRTPSACVRAI